MSLETCCICDEAFRIVHNGQRLCGECYHALGYDQEPLPGLESGYAYWQRVELGGVQ